MECALSVGGAYGDASTLCRINGPLLHRLITCQTLSSPPPTSSMEEAFASEYYEGCNDIRRNVFRFGKDFHFCSAPSLFISRLLKSFRLSRGLGVFERRYIN